MIKFLLWVCFILILFILFTAYFAIKYNSPYKFYHVIGKPGSGKTTTMVKLAYKYVKKGYTVYANVDIPNTYRIDDSDITKYELKPKSVLLIDEIGLIFDNRNFKNFTPEQRDWWKLYRHRKLIIWSFSQDMDVDKKVRKLLSSIFVCVNYFGIYTVLKKVKRKFPVISKDHDGESQITDEYLVSPFITAPFGGRIYVFIPRWAKYFNSFEAKPLPEKEFRFVEPPDKIFGKRLKKKEKTRKKKIFKRRKKPRTNTLN